jgi:hypothetical protein
LAELVIPKAVTDWMHVALRESDVTESLAREQAIQHAQQECDRLNQRIEAMYIDKLDGRISTAFFDEKAAAWREEQSKLRRRISELRAASGFRGCDPCNRRNQRGMQGIPHATGQRAAPIIEHPGRCCDLERWGVRYHSQNAVPETAAIELRKSQIRNGKSR